MPRLSDHRHPGDPNKPSVRRAGLAVLLTAFAATVAAQSAGAATCSDGTAPEPNNVIDARSGTARDRVAAPKSAQLTAPAALAAPADRTQAERLLHRGEAFLAQGNIAVARQYFARAAESGLPLAAFRLAETYDPTELARLNTRGVVADPTEARRWYQQAQSALLPESTARLGRLGNGSPCPVEQPAAVPVSRTETEAGDRKSDQAPSVKAPSASNQAPSVKASSVSNQAPSVEAPSAGNQAPSVEAPSAGNQAPSVEAPSAGNQAPSVEVPSAGNQAPSVKASSVSNQAPSVEAPSAGNQAPSVEAPSVSDQAPSVEER